jgi:hypothetical protein
VALERQLELLAPLCPGRLRLFNAFLGPEALVRQLRRRRPKGGQRSLREISAELAQRGILNERGDAYSAASINSLGRLSVICLTMLRLTAKYGP